MYLVLLAVHTAGKKPVVYIVTPGYGGAQFQIACKAGKEKELIKYLQDTREEIFHAEEFDYHWLKEDVQALYDDDRRVATVFTLFATISIFVSALGLFGLSLFDIRRRKPQNLSLPRKKRGFSRLDARTCKKNFFGKTILGGNYERNNLRNVQLRT